MNEGVPLSALMTLEIAQQVTGGRLLVDETCGAAPHGRSFCGVTIDSRAVQRGQAFIAIAGPRFDGHTFVEQAAAAGAALLVVSRPPGALLPRQTPVLLVDDTRRALGALARAWRTTVAPRVVGVTGSMGKTTTKELTCQVLRRAGATHGTAGNFNNDVGLPLTLLAMPPGTEFLVAEMGMNAPGEIAYLTTIAAPDVGVVTNIAPVHLAGLGSLQAIAAAKGELLQALRGEATAVLPGSEARLQPYVEHLPVAQRITFGTRPSDRVRIVATRPRGSTGVEVSLALDEHPVQFVLPLVGRYNVDNAAAAAAVGFALGVEPAAIAEALSQPPALSHRSSLRRIGAWQVLDDCYNASPRAVVAALDTLVQLAAGAPAWAVLGAMAELGPESAAYHEQVGHHAAALPLSGLVTVGATAAAIAAGARDAGMPTRHIVEVADAAEAAARVAQCEGGWLLLKASRGARLEEFLLPFAAALQKSTAASNDPS